MRSSIIIASGIALWVACVAVARLLGPRGEPALTTATAGCAVPWLMVAGANMWIGVTRAGYSVRDELPIFLIIYLIPTIVAVIVWSRWR